MLGFNQFIKLPTRLATWMLLVSGVLYLSGKWAFSTVKGVFFLSIAAYSYLWWKSNSRPLSPTELLDWYLGLRTDTQAAIAAVMLTVVSFFIAFRTAHMNWLRQKRIELNLRLDAEIETFFHEASTLAIKANIYAERLVEFSDGLSRDGNNEAIQFDAKYIGTQTPAFFEVRKRLSEMGSEVHRIRGRNTGLLSSHWGMIKSLDTAIELFLRTTELMWFAVPRLREDDPEIAASLSRQINLAEVKRFIAAQDADFARLNSITGRISGQLKQPVTAVNLSSLAFIFSNTDVIGSALEYLRNKPTRPRAR